MPDPNRHPPARGRDLADAILVAACLPVAWLLPERVWPRFAAPVARVQRLLTVHPEPDLGAVLREHFPSLPVADLVRGFRVHNVLELLAYLREWAPWGWHPTLRVHGLEHIDDALRAGDGVVLWVSDFIHSDLVIKKALFEAGRPYSHLSTPTHGFQSPTVFGRRVLNPIKARMEERYLEERCVMQPGTPGDAIRRLAHLLGRPGVVSVTALSTGRRTSTCPLFGGVITLAKGAPSFFARTPSRLLPVFSFPRAAGGFEVHVEPPLEVARSGDEDAIAKRCIAAYVERLEARIRQFPELWRGWLGPRSYWTYAP